MSQDIREVLETVSKRSRKVGEIKEWIKSSMKELAEGISDVNWNELARTFETEEALNGGEYLKVGDFEFSRNNQINELLKLSKLNSVMLSAGAIPGTSVTTYLTIEHDPETIEKKLVIVEEAVIRCPFGNQELFRESYVRVRFDETKLQGAVEELDENELEELIVAVLKMIDDLDTDSKYSRNMLRESSRRLQDGIEYIND